MSDRHRHPPVWQACYKALRGASVTTIYDDADALLASFAEFP